MKLVRRKDLSKSIWVPIVAIGGFAAFLFLFKKVVGGIPLVTKVYHRTRADGVLPQLQNFLSWWEVKGAFPIMVGVDGGVRDLTDQARLYAKGRTTRGEPPYTAERPLGQTVTGADTNVNSAHGHAAALDLWPVDSLGRPQFNVNDPTIYVRYLTIGSLAKQHGLSWGGDWISRKDYPHIEIVGWASLPVINSKSSLA